MTTEKRRLGMRREAGRPARLMLGAPSTRRNVISTSAPRSSHRSSAAVEQYVSGRRAIVTGTAFFLEAAQHLDPVLGITRPGDTVIVPAVGCSDGDAADRAGVTVIGYEGSWRKSGDRMTVDRHHRLALQDYATISSVSIVEPTVVRQSSAEGLDLFFGDADAARLSGVFVDQLVGGFVLLDSHASLLGRREGAAALVRVHVTEAGEYRDGADGLLLGGAGDSREAIEVLAASGAGGSRAFDRIVDRDDLEAALDARPWMARYLAAVDLLQEWWGRAYGPVAVSGFGGHLVTALDRYDELPAITTAAAPFLTTGVDEEFILVDQSSRRRFRLDVVEARAAECVIATGDDFAASALLAAETGKPARAVAAAVREVTARFAAIGLDLTAFAAGDTA